VAIRRRPNVLILFRTVFLVLFVFFDFFVAANTFAGPLSVEWRGNAAENRAAKAIVAGRASVVGSDQQPGRSPGLGVVGPRAPRPSGPGVPNSAVSNPGFRWRQSLSSSGGRVARRGRTFALDQGRQRIQGAIARLVRSGRAGSTPAGGRRGNKASSRAWGRRPARNGMRQRTGRGTAGRRVRTRTVRDFGGWWPGEQERVRGQV